MLGHDQGFKCASAVARDVDPERASVGDERLAAAAVAMVGSACGFVFARRVAQMQAHFGVQGALDDRAFQTCREVVYFAAGQGGTDQCVKRSLHLRRQRGRVARIDNRLLNHAQLLGFALVLGHISFLSRTGEYALHTKILTGS